LKSFGKVTVLSVGAGRERPGVETALILITILWKRFFRKVTVVSMSGSGAARAGKSFDFQLRSFRKVKVLSVGAGRERQRL